MPTMVTLVLLLFGEVIWRNLFGIRCGDEIYYGHENPLAKCNAGGLDRQTGTKNRLVLYGRPEAMSRIMTTTTSKLLGRGTQSEVEFSLMPVMNSRKFQANCSQI